ncbi:flagellar hook-length control protein FliK [Myxococcus llanfairpwllgwyngyllgogerychwyrndrobwllllantysiliogogogochensis]|uniref:Flagellar hook-length control protein FliK n=1 Tax=Myxococcus llanfairpwllgwyngyllgogerychwyrndrobwllllantysiliogogogochensis TaxID=2590453 RepID=A0A540WP17_9BACT|nr:flagellar hook-length control protein FliK [Myxococcus llanfairpwllgwyngyllgogerychwyrndrobwllllantysiliogogogochensis]TQF10763.1 flagellar hook-length control protein FliK [Myxococcus llanfairpwllgwyngyllgogerychwyrndrobwllllantysiliogogogochensis]
MSRVDDDRETARLAERIMQEKKLAEGQAKKRTEGASAFQKLMQPQAQPQATAPAPAPTPQTPGAFARQVLAKATQEGKTFGEQAQQPQLGGNPAGLAQTQRRADSGATEARSGSRAADSKEDKRTSEGRDKDMSKAESALGQVSSEKGALIRADADAGGGKGSGGGGKDKKEGGGAEMAPGFRFNPALMAPVPVAKPKDTAGSERLRAMASEIAQKIVDRVRVGTNAAGLAEFQIDLRGDVLSGLSIKVSARNGKISATFSGTNRDVLKMLEEHSEGLRTALGGRGLKLETVRFEAKT